MNKHIKKTKPMQSRRLRALERFKVKAGGSPEYLARKAQEKAALESRLGFPA